ncbi:hypothetical protein KOR42_36590 [Thalassoglobus neptunius]|uniref:Uncharacterized protein n=1 Tax=Thalassoglobus neptunius TaxID=1938619 RepID=A0A5C5WJT4_9PLAN|nr:hypothetical protein KOR42_36590 [Thalassoglobus neptunius]
MIGFPSIAFDELPIERVEAAFRQETRPPVTFWGRDDSTQDDLLLCRADLQILELDPHWLPSMKLKSQHTVGSREFRMLVGTVEN